MSRGHRPAGVAQTSVTCCSAFKLWCVHCSDFDGLANLTFVVLSCASRDAFLSLQDSASDQLQDCQPPTHAAPSPSACVKAGLPCKQDELNVDVPPT